MGTWHSNYSDYLKFYHLSVIRPFVDRFIRSFYDHMPVFVPVRPYHTHTFIRSNHHMIH